MTSVMTYYGELGISFGASHRAVLVAYRQRALQTHPDKGGSHDAYVKVRQAFEVLSDRRQRAEYDAELRRRGGADGDVTPQGSTATPSASSASLAGRGPLALAGETAWQLAARTIVSMLDLPETAWASALEVHTMEVLECCRRQLQRGRDAPNLRGQAATESSTSAGEGPPIRGLYQTKRGSWEISLSILKVQCAIFNVADIARAHDWHIALVELRQKVDELTKKGKTDREAFRVAVDEAYEADPELRLVLGFRVSIREARKVINGPFTYRLETALQLRNRVQQLRDMGGASYDVDKEIRDAKAYEKKQRDLHRARQAAMLQEVSTALEHLRREERRKQQQAPLALPAPPAAEPAEAPEVEPAGEFSVPLKGFAKFCRGMSLSKAQRGELLRKVQDDVELQRSIREAIVRHCGNLRGKLSIQDGSARALQHRRPQAGEVHQLVPYLHPGPRRKSLVELLLEKHEGAFYPGLLTLCELMRVTTTSRRVYSASAPATKRQFTNFSVADLGRRSAKSKRGRALPQGGQLRMLRECLRTRRIAVHVRHLDVSSLEMASMTKEEFQYMLGCLPNLASVVLPSKGWAGNLQLRTFVNVAKSLKVSIGAPKHADIILRGVGRTPEPPRPRAVRDAPGRGRKRSRSREARRARPRQDVAPAPEAPAYTAPALGALALAPAPAPMLMPETPATPPAIQALRSGNLRRPRLSLSKGPKSKGPKGSKGSKGSKSRPVAPFQRPEGWNPPRLRPEKAEAPGPSEPRERKEGAFWWLERM